MSIVAWHLHCGAKAEEGPIEDKVPLGWSLSLFEVGHNDQKLALAMDVPTVEVIHAVEKGPMLRKARGLWIGGGPHNEGGHMGYEIAHAMKCPHSYGYSTMVQKAPWL